MNRRKPLQILKSTRLFSLLLLFIVLINVKVYAQFDGNDESGKDTLTDCETGINIYDKFNPLLGGDSVRWMEPSIKCTGSYEENYPGGKLKHKGYFNNGQLTTIYKNYYENGQLERSFKVTDTRSCQMEQYYKDGKQRLKEDFFKGNILVETDYYPNGKMEYYEKNDKSFQFYKTVKYYFENGNPQNTIDLVKRKNLIYHSKEYWENGNIKEEGTIFFNKVLRDYQKNGTWIIYNNTGRKISEEDYIKGQLNEERKF